MRIRAITIGQTFPIFFESQKREEYNAILEGNLKKFSSFNNDLIENFKNESIQVETKRICSQPFLKYENQINFRDNTQKALSLLSDELNILQSMFNKHDFDYFACSTMLPDELEHFSQFEKSILNEMDKFLIKFPTFFTSLPVVSGKSINFSALKSGAKIIKTLSEPDPFNNLKFCISSNVPPNTPFFPAAYHKSSVKPAFSIAIEMADEVVKIFSKAPNLTKAKNRLRNRFLEIYDLILNICERVSQKHDIEFFGMDFSPAPYPDPNRSIGTAIENLGIDYFGANGSVFGVALLTNAIPKNKEKIIGFSGLMDPVFEDYTIAKRLSEKKFNLDSLLLYSTMCGTGLDCVPLPGDISERELFYILLDMCTISIKLNKPLTARLMPIPGKNAGDDVEFDFEYFAPSKVIEIRRLPEIKKNKNDLFNRDEKSFSFDKIF